MSDEPIEKPAKGKAAEANAPAPNQVATIRTVVGGVEARGFTFGASQIVPGVSRAMAERLESLGHAKIIDLSDA